jgi:hypothetical protein
VDGFRVENGASLSGETAAVRIMSSASGTRVQSCILAGPSVGINRGILTEYNVDDLVVAKNRILGWTSGIYLNPTPAASGLRISGNIIEGNLVGIGSDGINNLLLRGNAIRSNSLEGWGYSDVGNAGGRGLVADSNSFAGNGVAVNNYTAREASPDTLNARWNGWASPYGPFDSLGTVEVPASPVPGVAQMRNRLPYGYTGERVSEYVDYYPWLLDSVVAVPASTSPGWNLLSIPVVTATLDPDVLFPGHVGGVFDYDNALQDYVPAATLQPGRGYWVQFASSGTIEMAGAPITSFVREAPQPGWSVIGSIAVPFPVSSIVTTPPGAISGTIFQFDAATQQYQPASALLPGYGYWVLTIAASAIIVGP